MIPYTLIKDEKMIFLHGIPHPAPYFPLQDLFIHEIKMDVEKRISEGEKWYCESGIERLFDINGIIPLWPFPEKIIDEVRNTPHERNVDIQNNLAEKYAKLRENLPTWQIYAESMTCVSDLHVYRALYHPSPLMILDIDNHNSGRPLRIYKKFIDRCIDEQILLKDIEGSQIHFLSGIGHEVVLSRINWSTK